MAGGIYSANLWKCAALGLDSRFRGNDRRLEWFPIANDTSAPVPGPSIILATVPGTALYPCHNC
jgi:hypothetical protein